MTIGELLYQCNLESKNIFRNYEKINKKIIDAEWSKTFNEVCIKENLWPTYTNLIYMFDFTKKKNKVKTSKPITNRIINRLYS